MFVLPPSPRPNSLGRSQPARASARWGTLSLALGAGLAAALLAFLLLRGRMASGAATPDLVSVVIAAQDIPARMRLTENLLQVRRVPPTEAPDGSVGVSTDLVGRVTIRPIGAGKAVTTQAVAAPGAALGLAFALPPSQRAVTVSLDPADGVGEFAQPGDHVDVLATDEPGSSPSETRTVLQNVTLLAVGSHTSPDDDTPAATSPNGPARVTVAVSPAQAQALVLAATRGKIHLALRPADDDAVAAVPAFSAPVPAPEERAASLPPSPRPHPRVAPPAPLRPLPITPLARVTITIIKGSQSQTVSVAP